MQRWKSCGTWGDNHIQRFKSVQCSEFHAALLLQPTQRRFLWHTLCHWVYKPEHLKTILRKINWLCKASSGYVTPEQRTLVLVQQIIGTLGDGITLLLFWWWWRSMLYNIWFYCETGFGPCRFNFCCTINLLWSKKEIHKCKMSAYWPISLLENRITISGRWWNVFLSRQALRRNIKAQEQHYS